MIAAVIKHACILVLYSISIAEIVGKLLCCKVRELNKPLLMTVIALSAKLLLNYIQFNSPTLMKSFVRRILGLSDR